MKLKNLKKTIVFGVLFSACISLNVANAANQVDISQDDSEVHIESVVDNEISPHADQIITKFRRYNNVLQYRRWNATKGYWVDPDWIDAP